MNNLYETNKLRKLRIAIYSRKSVYTNKGESIENQIEMCKQYIFSKIENVTPKDITVYEDEGFSAKSTDRPQFQKMINDINKIHYDYIVCYRLDRISRNVSDFASLIEDLNDRSISFICIKEEFDTSKPMGKAMMYIASVFAQLERETIAQRVRDNMIMLARTGRWLGGTPPTGFSSQKVKEFIIDGKTKVSCKLKQKSDEINIVLLIYEKYYQMKSLSSVSKYLTNKNIKSKNNKYFSLLTIKDILTNPVYCIADKEAYNYFINCNSDVCFNDDECSNTLGLISYNKRDYKKKNAIRQDKSQWIIAIGKHKGVISGKKWVAIQNLLDANKTCGKVKMHNSYSLLSGMIYCTQCGNKMFAKKRSNGNFLTYDYICNTKLKGNTDLCNCKNINGKQTDDIVLQKLKDYIITDNNIYKHLNKLKKVYKQNEKLSPIEDLNLKIKKCNDNINNLMNAIAKPNLDDAFIKQINLKVTKLINYKQSLITQKDKMILDENDINKNQSQINAMVNTLSNLKENLILLNITQKQTLVKLLIKKIEWDGKELNISLYV